MSFAALKTLFKAKSAEMPKIKVVIFTENGERASETLYDVAALLG